MAEIDGDDAMVDNMLAQWYGDAGDSLQKLQSDIDSAIGAGDKAVDVEEEEDKEEEDKEEEEEAKPLEWVEPIARQTTALFVFAVPDKFDPVHDDWAMMFAGAYPSVEAAETVQEELMNKDDRFTTMVCQMYDGIARFPPLTKEYNGRVRYRSKHMQDVHDSFRNNQQEAKTILKSEAEKRVMYREKDATGAEIEDLDTEHGQMFPVPTTSITKQGVKQGVVDAEVIIDKGLEGAAQQIAQSD